MTGLQSSKRLPWQDCECGCKGNCVTVGRMQLWFGEEISGIYTLRKGHGSTGQSRGDFKTVDEVDLAARSLAKPEFDRMKQELDTLEACFA